MMDKLIDKSSIFMHRKSMESFTGIFAEKLNLAVDVGAATRAKYREDSTPNQDAFFVDSYAAGVLDGLGGIKGSESAAQLGALLLPAELALIPTEYHETQSVKAFRSALEKVNERVLGLEGPDDDHNPASTVCAVKLFRANSQHLAMFGHAGDTRGTQIRGGQVVTETIDHTYSPDTTPAQKLRIQNEIGAATTSDQLEGLAKNHFESREKHKVRSCLGNEHPEFTITTAEIEPGDILAINSDGITGAGNLSTDEFIKCLTTPDCSAQQLAQLVVDKAFFASTNVLHPRRKPDDLTAVVLKIG